MDINGHQWFRLPQLTLLSGWRLRNFEIRVGQNAVDLGRNAICYKQVPTMADGATQNFICMQERYGNWVSVNKSDTTSNYVHLQLRELRVFGYRGKRCTMLYYMDCWFNLIHWDQGWGLLSQFPPFRYFPNFSALSKQTLAFEYHVYIWQVSPQLSCGDICQILMWFEKSYMYFCHIENFAYGENNEQSFSNPHPWTRWPTFCRQKCF